MSGHDFQNADDYTGNVLCSRCGATEEGGECPVALDAVTRPRCAACNGLGWIVPPPGPEEATRCACNPMPMQVVDLSVVHLSRGMWTPCGLNIRWRRASTNPSDATCPACLENMR